MRDLKGSNGYKNLTVDLQILAALFRESLPKIQGKAATTAEEVQTADRIAAAILRGVGLREQGTLSVAATADLRVRAFTLFSRVYDQARRAILYLRWSENDVDTIAPSLYAGRGGRKRPGTEVAPPPSPSPAGAAPGSPAPGTSVPGPTTDGAAPQAGSKPGTAGPETHPFIA